MGVQDSVRKARLPLVGILLLALALRWPLWTAFRFREDEALYGYWAWLIYSRVDVMLRSAPVDKPPLFPYLLAYLYDIFLPSEVAARLPSLMASFLSLPLLYAWTRDLFGHNTAWRAMLFYAVMPLAVLLAPTAYMDALMVGFCLLAVWAAGRERPHPWGWAVVSGLALAAGIATKPFAILWLPLVWGTAVLLKRCSWRWGGFWLAGFAYPLWRWWGWEHLRGAPYTLTMGFLHYGGLSLVPPQRWGERLLSWTNVAAASWGGAGILGLVVGLSLVGMGEFYPVGTPSPRRGSLAWLWAWLLAVLLVFVGGTISVWDRYLLVLAPVWVVLAARGWQRLAMRSSRITFLIVPILLWIALGSGRAAYPVGGDHGAYDGVDAVAAYIMAELPRGGVVYHHWLGWHFGFYLFGAPYDYRWWPDVAWLAGDAASEPAPKVLVFPAWHERERQAAMRALARVGVPVRLVARVPGRDGGLRFWVYALGER